MSEQNVRDHFKQIEFWQQLLVTSFRNQMDWCDRLAVNVVIERIRGKDADHINTQVQSWIDNHKDVAVGYHGDDYEAGQYPLEAAPSIEAVIERANELTALYQKVDKVS
ncbi:hypothetical protein [Synechococcus sp. MU1625]|uniref:hypothetical protein n=1 Tax=Synechococcus sp. MU1625 TaxID=2508347 RepID=UPI001CF7F171|nr:hypothetical protein [Synechococcus sp. MU1625]MCB4399305.1 hypothetical protein [Synechococcus sp. MU1625]